MKTNRWLLTIALLFVCLNSYALTIAEQLTAVNNARLDIRNSIINKGVAVPSDTKFEDYDTKIDAIPNSTGLAVNNYKVMINNGASATESISSGDLVVVTQTWAKIANSALTTGTIYVNGRNVVMSDDGNYLAVVKNSDLAPASIQSWKWNATNLRYESTADADTLPTGGAHGIAMSSDGQYLSLALIASPYIVTYKWNSANNRYEKTADVDTLPPGACFTTTMSNDGSRMAVGYQTSPYFSTYTWNSGNNRYEINTTADLTPTYYPHDVVMSGDGEYLAVTLDGSTQLEAYKWNTGNGRYEATANTFGNGLGVPTGFDNDLAMSDDGSRLVFANGTGALTTFQWNATNNRYEKDTNQPPLHSASGRGGHVTISNDGSTIIFCYNSSSTDHPAQPLVLQWDAGNSVYSEMPYPDTLLTSSESMYGAAINDAIDRFVIAGENYIYTYTLPSTYTTQASKLDNTTAYTIPSSDDRCNWALIGTAQNSGNTGDNIGINSFIYFKNYVTNYLTTP